jgi:hypothetical protein
VSSKGRTHFLWGDETWGGGGGQPPLYSGS